MVIRGARRADRDSFMELWRLMLEALRRDYEAEILPTQRSLDWYGTLFDRCLAGQLKGVALVALRDGITVGGLLATELPGEIPWDTTWGRAVQGWGTSVAPGVQQTGIAKALYQEAIVRLRRLGFDSYLGAWHEGNKGGEALLRSMGARVLQTMTCIDLKEAAS